MSVSLCSHVLLFGMSGMFSLRPYTVLNVTSQILKVSNSLSIKMFLPVYPFSGVLYSGAILVFVLLHSNQNDCSMDRDYETWKATTVRAITITETKIRRLARVSFFLKSNFHYRYNVMMQQCMNWKTFAQTHPSSFQLDVSTIGIPEF